MTAPPTPRVPRKVLFDLQAALGYSEGDRVARIIADPDVIYVERIARDADGAAHLDSRGKVARHVDVIGVEAATVEPEPLPDPEPTVIPMLAHSPANKGDYWQSIRERPWADGPFVYNPGPWGRRELRWDPYWEAATAARPEGMETVVSPKYLDAPALQEFVEHLPAAWAERMTFAYWQEPEDNFTTEDERAAFRDVTGLAAPILWGAGIRNAVHLQAWTLNPNNGQPWAGAENLAQFIDPNVIDRVEWSIYEYHLKDRADEQVGRIVDFMDRYAPGISWGASACGISVPVGTPADDERRVIRANLVEGLILTVTQAGGKTFGWFDWPDWDGKDYSAQDPALAAVLADTSIRTR